MDSGKAKLRIGFIAFPNFVLLDLAGPADILAQLPDAEVQILWKTLDPVSSDSGLQLVPTTRYDQCDGLDVICVPGGPGQIEMMEDIETLAFLRRIAPGCQFITAVCTGSLILGAAGLLQGYRATSHWASVDQLALLGALPVSERVVMDGNRMTGAGVSAGLDFALALAAELGGARVAQKIQLRTEYDPAPPFDSGSPGKAEPGLLAEVREAMQPYLERRRRAATAAGARLSDAGLR